MDAASGYHMEENDGESSLESSSILMNNENASTDDGGGNSMVLMIKMKVPMIQMVKILPLKMIKMMR